MPDPNEVLDPQDLAADSTSAEETNSQPESETASGETAKPGEGENEHKVIPKKRFDEVYGKWRNTEREAAFWREQALAAKAPAKEPTTVETKEDREPEPADFDLGDGTYDLAKYTKAHGSWVVQEAKKQSGKVLETQTKAQREESEYHSRVQTFQQKAAEYAKTKPDFLEAIQDSSLPISKAMFDEILDAELPAEVFDYLIENREEAERIYRLNERQTAREIGRIEARLAGTKSKATEDGEEEPPKPPSKAPIPPAPVRRGSISVKPFNPADPTSYGDFADYEKKMAAYEKRQKG